jgi:hypothetical protein
LIPTHLWYSIALPLSKQKPHSCGFCGCGPYRRPEN